MNERRQRQPSSTRRLAVADAYMKLNGLPCFSAACHGCCLQLRASVLPLTAKCQMRSAGCTAALQGFQRSNVPVVADMKNAERNQVRGNEFSQCRNRRQLIRNDGCATQEQNAATQSFHAIPPLFTCHGSGGVMAGN